ncbi:DNA cytosine methyltransferase [Leptospira alstonii]|uniref:DNA (cytosine-5-)-methyltransferase n=2 Tax=Leptospira alstonii TaxID=28452 RepID=M6D8R4_9LEPT|nr:DNA cytosine methyltransferase [Leptospira alstonii]EMJ94945.1 DNA (cytosine-5-)-methyltransferase [Leptospira alstonii serovar Sichuan str. 79601]EQA80635.1 DNA (cytosine-5-)-methyltransferase [Leptospira alstonii serovar Pingchang str. 80-412]
MKTRVAVVDLFCGIGGLALGLKNSGLDIVAGIDSDESCRYAFEQNIKSLFLNRDLSLASSEEVKNLFPSDSTAVLVGCAPCQPFSKHSNKIADRKSDERWNLLKSFKELVKEIQPTIVSMENVPELVKAEIFEEFVNALEENSYFVSWDILCSAHYGVPQMRKRLVLIASKLGKIPLPVSTYKEHQFRTVRDAIGGRSLKNKWKNDALHVPGKLSNINLKRIQVSTPGGSWKDWPAYLKLPCHQRASGKSYSAVYGRLEWDLPAPTITTQFHTYGTGRFGHPEEDRALTLREGALLQTFPKTFKFLPTGQKPMVGTLGRHIGNAVPVKLAYAIGKTILKHLTDYDKI